MLYINEKQFVNGQKTRERTLVNNNDNEDDIQHVMIRPHIPLELWEMLHDFSMFLIVDDKHDLGHFDYYGRKDHYYRFKQSPDHPSPFHHYQLGIVGLVVAQIGGLFSKALELKNDLNPPKDLPHRFKRVINLPASNVKALPYTPAKQQQQSNKNTYSKLVTALDTL